MTTGDYLEAAKDALGDSLTLASPGSPDEHRLVALASAHALIAIAEGLRALVGVMSSIPIEDDPGEEGWRGENRD